MKWVMNAWLGERDWIKEYTDDVLFYDKKDLNVGYNIYDYMDWIVNNYDNLPSCVLFGKTNMLERHITKEEFDKIYNEERFTPLLTQNHQVDGYTAYYRDGMYYEKNTSWYFNHYETRTKTFDQIAEALGIPSPSYIPFAPGACYIVPRENILKHPKEKYEKIRDMVSWTQLPAEAHGIERALYLLWS